MATKYERGRRYEYKAKAALEAEGYSCIRAAASKGLFDVVGVGAVDTRLVQVKSTSREGKGWRDSNVSILEKLPVPPHVRKEVWVYRVGRGKPEVHLLEDRNDTNGIGNSAQGQLHDDPGEICGSDSQESFGGENSHGEGFGSARSVSNGQGNRDGSKLRSPKRTKRIVNLVHDGDV